MKMRVMLSDDIVNHNVGFVRVPVYSVIYSKCAAASPSTTSRSDLIKEASFLMGKACLKLDRKK